MVGIVISFDWHITEFYRIFFVSGSNLDFTQEITWQKYASPDAD